jgi:hypothetical protein
MYSEVQNQWTEEKEKAIENLLNNLNTDKFAIENLIGELNITDTDEKAWLYQNRDGTSNMIDFLKENNNSNQANLFLISTINILSSTLNVDEKKNQFIVAYDSFDPLLSFTSDRSLYESKIRQYAIEFERRGKPEFADYLLSILPLDNSYTEQDYISLYNIIREQKLNLFFDYFRAIVGQVYDSFEPLIEYALMEVGGTLALKLIQRLPTQFITTPLKNIITSLSASGSTAFSNLKYAKKFGFKPYSEWNNFFRNILNIKRSNLGVQAHHLFEVRLAQSPAISNFLGSNTNTWNSLILTTSEHGIFTARWKAAIGYRGQAPGWTGFNSNNVTVEAMKNAARQIYKDYPEILLALGL